MHEINKICHLKSSKSPLGDDAEKNFKDFGKFSFEHFIRSPARQRSTSGLLSDFFPAIISQIRSTRYLTRDKAVL